MPCHFTLSILADRKNAAVCYYSNTPLTLCIWCTERFLVNIKQVLIVAFPVQFLVWDYNQ